MNLSLLKQRLREISLWDKVRSKLSVSPSDDYCELYDTWLTNFLEGGVEIIDIDIYNMELKNNQGKTATFWVENYPYSYGYRESPSVGISHPHFTSKPSWKNVFRLRKLQLSKKDELIERFTKERLECD